MHLSHLALSAAMVFPNWAAAHVLRFDDVQPSQLTNDERERLTREFLPIVHDCPQTPATFHAQSMSEEVLTKACIHLKEYEDNFHAQMQTDPRESREDRDGDFFSRVDVLAFDDAEDRDNYALQFYGAYLHPAVYVRGDMNIQPHPRIVPGLFKSERANSRPNLHPWWYFSALEHEYMHYLDDRYFGLVTFDLVTGFRAMSEGLATHLQHLPGDRYIASRHRSVEQLIGDGSSLLTISDVHYEEHDGFIQYAGGALLIQFLIEEHPQVLSDIKGIVRRRPTSEQHSAYRDYVEEVFPTLESDFHRWQREFVPLTVREIEPITASSDDQPPLVNLVYYFYTSREVTINVSLSGSDVSYTHSGESSRVRSEALEIDYNRYRMRLWPGYGVSETVEVTVTATTRDGESAEQTFTVTVVPDLKTKAILPDTVDIEEGETAINLESYYTGPALSEVEFTVTSNNTGVARVAVRGGQLIITPVAVGEADITVRSVYRGQDTKQTFTITVTDVCPSCVTVTDESLAEVITIFQRVNDDGGLVYDGTWSVSIHLRDYFASTQQLTYTVSLSVPYETYRDGPWFRSQILSGSVQHERLLLSYRSAPGTVEITVTATAPNGDSAELTFIVNVVQGLQTRDISVRDVSTVEGEAAIDLSAYFTGPALSAIEFTAESNDTDVALVTVLDGRLVITAVSGGEAEVTVRSEYYDRVTTQTFTITVTDDCPSWLCRGFFNGWRWLLLEDEQAIPATETE